MFWYFFLPFFVSAHVPEIAQNHFTQNTAYQIGDVHDKSWGIYVHASNTTWYQFRGKKDKLLSISISSPLDPSRKGLVLAELHGPNAHHIQCTKNWTGWSKRRLEEDILTLPVAYYQKSKFEPFGVGGYIPLTACNGTFPNTANYFLKITPIPKRRVYFAVGAGMSESFSFVEIITISYKIYQTFVWSGINLFSVFGPHLFFFLLGSLLTLFFHEKIFWRILCLFGAFTCLASPFIFLIQLIYVAHYKVDMGAKIAIPLLLHLLFPLLINSFLLWYCLQIWTYKSPEFSFLKGCLLFGFGLLQYALTWQSYIIGPTFLFIGAILYCITAPRTSNYKIIPNKV